MKEPHNHVKTTRPIEVMSHIQMIKKTKKDIQKKTIYYLMWSQRAAIQGAKWQYPLSMKSLMVYCTTAY